MAWLNRSNILFAGRDKWSLDPRVQLLAHSAAEFAIAIARVDAYDEGLYTCSFQTRLRPHTAQLYLIVQGAPWGRQGLGVGPAEQGEGSGRGGRGLWSKGTGLTWGWPI